MVSILINKEMSDGRDSVSSLKLETLGGQGAP